MKLVWTSVLLAGLFNASTLALPYPADSSSEVTPTRPECVVGSECPLDKACINQNCKDPCHGTCGFNTNCEVIRHNPICSCMPNFRGDPFVKCDPPTTEQTEVTEVSTTEHQVRLTDSQEDHMIDEYESCDTNEDCDTDKHCSGKQCVHPCDSMDCYETLGQNSYCKADRHKAFCLCAPGYYRGFVEACFRDFSVKCGESSCDPRNYYCGEVDGKKVCVRKSTPLVVD